MKRSILSKRAWIGLLCCVLVWLCACSTPDETGEATETTETTETSGEQTISSEPGEPVIDLTTLLGLWAPDDQPEAFPYLEFLPDGQMQIISQAVITDILEGAYQFDGSVGDFYSMHAYHNLGLSDDGVLTLKSETIGNMTYHRVFEFEGEGPSGLYLANVLPFSASGVEGAHCLLYNGSDETITTVKLWYSTSDGAGGVFQTGSVTVTETGRVDANSGQPIFETTDADVVVTEPEALLLYPGQCVYVTITWPLEEGWVPHLEHTEVRIESAGVLGSDEE